MKKSVLVLFFAAILSIAAMAQSIQEGVGHFYAQRYQSARTTFEKLIASNPNNIEANYWLGQVLIAQKNIAAARSHYEKAVTSSNNAPLLLVGLGHVNLLEGKGPEARQQFETAINASRGKKGSDPNVLNAIGRANVEAYTEKDKLGDLNYAIAKLTEAAQAAPNNPDIYLNLGNAYRKSRAGNSGGLAIQNYMKAMQLNPSLAVAPYRAAMLYKTQVNYNRPEAWTVVLDNLNNAIAADPKFAPAYMELYNYHLLARRDFATAEGFANKYISSTDPSVENNYLKAQTVWLQNKFDDAISIAKDIISQTNNAPNPRVYRLLAYSYAGKKDTSTACTYVNEFFTKSAEEDLLAQDYILHAQMCARNNADLIMQDVSKAVELDTITSKKIATLRDFAREAKANNQRNLEATLNKLAYNLEGADANINRLIGEIAVPYYFGGAFDKADSAAQAYATAAPDSIHGHYWSALARSAMDSGTVSKGLAVGPYEKVLSIAETDKVRFKSQGVRAAQTLAVYYNNVKEDRAAALAVIQRGLDIDPGNSSLLEFQKALQPRQSGATQKSSTSANQAKDTKVKAGNAKVKTDGNKTKVKKG